MTRKKARAKYQCQNCRREMVRPTKDTPVEAFETYVHLHTGLRVCAEPESYTGPIQWQGVPQKESLISRLFR